MAHSRRNKLVSLTKVQKKGRDRKVEHIDKLRDALPKYRYTYVVRMDHTRTDIIQDFRANLKPGCLMACKNRILQVALGTTPETSHLDNTYQLSGLLTGPSSLILTDLPPAKLKSLVQKFEQPVFANPGDIATETVVLQAGTDALQRFPFSLETQLRKLGLPTQLSNGKIVLLGDATVCTEGQALTANAAQLLRHLGIKQARFAIDILGRYDRDKSKVTMA